jgi:hypothetical protein
VLCTTVAISKLCNSSLLFTRCASHLLELRLRCTAAAALHTLQQAILLLLLQLLLLQLLLLQLLLLLLPLLLLLLAASCRTAHCAAAAAVASLLLLPLLLGALRLIHSIASCSRAFSACLTALLRCRLRQ